MPMRTTYSDPRRRSRERKAPIRSTGRRYVLRIGRTFGSPLRSCHEGSQPSGQREGGAAIGDLRRPGRVDAMGVWSLVYEEFDPGRQGLRELAQRGYGGLRVAVRSAEAP